VPQHRTTRCALPRIGDFAAVYWNDACNWRKGAGLAEADTGLCPATTLGVVTRLCRKEIHVAQTRFTLSDGSHEYSEVQCIPRSQVTHIETGKMRRRKG
jgi:hypothetical protein